VIASRPVSPVRILLDYRPALRQRTGVGEYVHELARALVATSAADPVDIALFSSSWKHRLAADAVPGTHAIDRRVPGRLLNLAWHRLGWPPVEHVTRQTFDVVHAFHPLLIPTTGAAQLVTIHDLDFLDHPERTRAEIRRDYPRLAARHARRAHHVVVNSAATQAEVVRRLGVPAARITVCHPGAPDWTARTIEPPDGCLLFLGTLEPRKNLGVLLDAYERLLSRLPDAPRLVLAGKPGADMTLLNARIADRPLAGKVDVPGYVEPADREVLFGRALVFVMPSHTEGFGMPVLEAMTVGVPVVASDRGALPEVGGDAARYFEPDDVEGLSQVLTDLIQNPEARHQMRQRGWRQRRRFDWHTSAGQLRQAWTCALGDRRARG
jgi:glycosyltransferase involved in cell wall biosynthesis